MTGPGHGLVGVADAGAFLARLLRLDPRAPVRLVPTADARRAALWAPLPFGVLVTRTVRAVAPVAAVVAAADLLAVLVEGAAGLPVTQDLRWRWALPPHGGSLVETVPATELTRLAAAAADTLRSASMRPDLAQRPIRDALLDHVALVVTRTAPMPADPAIPSRVEVPQRLVQAVTRMGFIGHGAIIPEDCAQVRVAARWVALAAPYGTAWLPPVREMVIRTRSTHTNG